MLLIPGTEKLTETCVTLMVDSQHGMATAFVFVRRWIGYIELAPCISTRPDVREAAGHLWQLHHQVPTWYYRDTHKSDQTHVEGLLSAFHFLEMESEVAEAYSRCTSLALGAWSFDRLTNLSQVIRPVTSNNTTSNEIHPAHITGVSRTNIFPKKWHQP